MKFKQIKISDIEANVGQIEGLPKNPRIIEESELEELAISIKELPLLLEARPVIVFPFNNKFVAIAGNQRTKSAKDKLGWETINCAVLPIDTPVKTLREIAIKDNNSWGSYDFEALQQEWDLAELQEWNTELPEFESEPSYEELIADEKNKPAIMKITFENPGQLKNAQNDIQELIDRKYNGAYLSISAGEL